MYDAVSRPTPPADATAWPRRITHAVNIGGVLVGGGNPVVVQSMTNTDTADVQSSVRQVAELWRAGSAASN
jgi:(E)-4-hydroxy-3-methylbut-2-enyl-diphosphate synthase